MSEGRLAVGHAQVPRRRADAGGVLLAPDRVPPAHHVISPRRDDQAVVRRPGDLEQKCRVARAWNDATFEPKTVELTENPVGIPVLHCSDFSSATAARNYSGPEVPGSQDAHIRVRGTRINRGVPGSGNLSSASRHSYRVPR